MPVSLPPALGLSLDLLRCPVCRTRRLHPDHGALRCPVGHTFDITRHGYASLLTGTRATSGDDAAMVQAREWFLSTGAYAPVCGMAARLAVAAVSEQGTVVDVGCGTGYYLAGVLGQMPGARGLGLDTSVCALRSAARAHDRAAAVAWDVFRPFPLADGAADVVLNVFAPRNPTEFHRVLRPTGRLIVVRPTERHLAELRGGVSAMLTVDPAKEQRAAAPTPSPARDAGVHPTRTGPLSGTPGPRTPPASRQGLPCDSHGARSLRPPSPARRTHATR
ncbi:putative RNA methyltransferase [Streptomyces griseosporeus]|uniref:putative RNA methyltransferase n=1 Tax=Streptomyces griseosporeus TaxID=1910 RepID=UPI0037009A7E